MSKTDTELEVLYGADWYERALWRCPDCSCAYRVDGMYDYGGECYDCGNPMVLDEQSLDTVPF